jgi:hypothetical protein
MRAGCELREVARLAIDSDVHRKSVAASCWRIEEAAGVSHLRRAR